MGKAMKRFGAIAVAAAVVTVPAASAHGWKHGHRGHHQTHRVAATASVQAAAPVQLSSTKPAFVPNVLLVRFRRGVSLARQSDFLRGLGLRTKEEIDQLRVRSIYVEPARRADVVAALNRSP